MTSDLTATNVQAMLDLLKRRRMMFELMTGTVVPVDVSTQVNSSLFVSNPARIQVVMDGDTVPVNAQSLVGTVVMGSRVPVLYVPPSGYYIVGFLDVPPNTVVYFEPIVATSTSTTSLSEQVIFTTTAGPLGNGQVLWKDGHAYFVEVWSEAHTAVAQNPTSSVRLGALGGAVLLGGPRLQLPASNLDIDYDRHGYVINNTGSDVQDVLVVTVTLQSANAVTFGAIASGSRYVKVTDVGDVSQYPGATVV